MLAMAAENKTLNQQLAEQVLKMRTLEEINLNLYTHT